MNVVVLSRKLFESKICEIQYLYMVDYDINSTSEEVHQIYIEIKKQEKKLKYLKKWMKKNDQ